MGFFSAASLMFNHEQNYHRTITLEKIFAKFNFSPVLLEEVLTFAFLVF